MSVMIFTNRQTDKQTNRASNIELLRITAMLIIIVHHFCVHGILKVLESVPYPLTVDNLSWQLLLVQLMGWGGDMSNGIFIVITGYYMFGHKVKNKKIAILAMTMCFYSWLLGIIFYGGGFFKFSAGALANSLVPMWFGANWFVACYIIFSFFIPYINCLLERLTKVDFEKLILLLFAVDVLLPSFKAVTFVGGSQLIYFCFMYCVGAYCRKYLLAEGKYSQHNYWGKAVLLSLSVLLVTIMVFDIAGVLTGKDVFVKNAWHFVKLCGVFVTISMFCYFATMSYFYNAMVNKLAATTLGVYLIHDNNLSREVIWNTIYPNLDYLTSVYFPVIMLIKVVIVYLACIGIELFRLKLIEPLFFSLVDGRNKKKAS